MSKQKTKKNSGWTPERRAKQAELMRQRNQAKKQNKEETNNEDEIRAQESAGVTMESEIPTAKVSEMTADELAAAESELKSLQEHLDIQKDELTNKPEEKKTQLPAFNSDGVLLARKIVKVPFRAAAKLLKCPELELSKDEETDLAELLAVAGKQYAPDWAKSHAPGLGFAGLLLGIIGDKAMTFMDKANSKKGDKHDQKTDDSRTITTEGQTN